MTQGTPSSTSTIILKLNIKSVVIVNKKNLSVQMQDLFGKYSVFWQYNWIHFSPFFIANINQRWQNLTKKKSVTTKIVTLQSKINTGISIKML